MLPQEKSCHQEQVGIPAETDMAKDPHGDYEGNGDVYCKEPLEGEASDMCSPVPEWDIQDKYCNAYAYKSAHGSGMHFPDI